MGNANQWVRTHITEKHRKNMTQCKRYVTVDHDKTNNQANTDAIHDDKMLVEVIYQGYVRCESTRSRSHQVRTKVF